MKKNLFKIVKIAIILSVLGGGGSAGLYFYGHYLPDDWNIFARPPERTYYDINSVTIPVIFKGEIYKYILFDLSLVFSSDEYFEELSYHEVKIRDTIIKDIYFFITSRPMYATLDTNIVLMRLKPIVISLVRKLLKIDFDPEVEITNLIEKRHTGILE